MIWLKKLLRLMAVLPLCVLGVTGCAKNQPPAPLPHLKLSKTFKVESYQGVEVHFNHPVKSLQWSWNGTTKKMNLAKGKKSVLIPVKLPQGKQFSLTIEKASGPSTQPFKKSTVLTGQTAPSLQVVTNPGIWQFNVSPEGPFTLQFSSPVANRASVSQDIHFSPAISGTLNWTSATTANFVPDQPLNPTETVTMTLDGGVSGPHGAQGQYLDSTTIVRPFITASNQKIVVHEQLPETLTLYQNGKVMLKTKCNTGVTGATTPTGTFYIHSKVVKTDMSGVDPDGEKYEVKNVPWVMGLFGNTAIHGYQRAKYGFPQSNGCVELPIATAKKLYHMVDVGTPVVIEK